MTALFSQLTVQLWNTLSQLLIVLECVSLVLCRWNTRDIVTSNGKDKVSNIVVFDIAELATVSNDHLVASFAEVLLVVRVEVPASVEPDAHSFVKVIARNAYLSKSN